MEKAVVEFGVLMVEMEVLCAVEVSVVLFGS